MTALTTFRRTPLMAAALLSACASTATLDAQWADPQFAGRSYAQQPVLVACGAVDVTAQRLCEDQVLAELLKLGSRASLARHQPGAPTPPTAEAEAYLASAKLAGSAALVYTKAAPGYTGATRGGSSVGIGLGGFGGGAVGFGLGMSVPIGERQPVTAWGANTSVLDVASGRTVWSASGTSSTGTTQEQLASLAQRLVPAARQAGVL